MKITPNPGIMDIVPYKGGLSKIADKDRIIKLSSNETPYGPSPRAIEAYKNEADKLHLYPDGTAKLLRDSIGEVYGLNPEQIVCGAGSDEIISFLCQAFAGEGDEVIYTEHGFLMYAISAKAVGATPVSVKETNLRTDINNIASAVNKKTKIVFIANPNNPTGSYISLSELKELREKLPGNVLLVIDGAYAEYVLEEDYDAGSKLVDMAENTVMTRTFSKIYGLAALRVGWAYCPKSIADILNRVRGPFNVSSQAISAASEAVRDVEFTRDVCNKNLSNLKNFANSLEELGLRVHPSFANFLLVEFPTGDKNASAANDFLLSNGIIPRKVDNYGLSNCLRITVGVQEDNAEVVKQMNLFMNSN